MARQHVYPVCRPGARTYTLPRLSDLTLKRTSANQKVYHNSDRSIELIHQTAFNYLRILFYEGEGNLNKELLFDLKSDDAQALRDDFGAGLSNGNDFGWVFTETLFSMTSNLAKGYESETGMHARNNTLSPGDVICIGHKIGVTATNVNSFMQGTASYIASPPYQFSKFSLPLHDIYHLPMDAIQFADQKWGTFMWSGTRWVLLGSNNWVFNRSAS